MAFWTKDNAKGRHSLGAIALPSQEVADLRPRALPPPCTDIKGEQDQGRKHEESRNCEPWLLLLLLLRLLLLRGVRGGGVLGGLWPVEMRMAGVAVAGEVQRAIRRAYRRAGSPPRPVSLTHHGHGCHRLGSSPESLSLDMVEDSESSHLEVDQDRMESVCSPGGPSSSVDVRPAASNK